MIDGAMGFFTTAFALFLVTELTLIFEEVVLVRFELRRGFSGSKTSLLKIFERHALKILRIEGPIRHHLASGGKYLVVFLAAGCLPLWGGATALVPPHSLWVFLCLVFMGPVVQLALGWVARKGAGWPVLLTTTERTVGSATVLFTLAITLVTMTGRDSFTELIDSQNRAMWLALSQPLSILLAFAFAVVSLFMTFQSVFSRTGDARPPGWRFDDLLPLLTRTVWSIFIVDVFLGGATGPMGDTLFVVKAVVINVFSGSVAQLFFQLREDQAESFILWRLAPISIVILALSLIFPGGAS